MGLEVALMAAALAASLAIAQASVSRAGLEVVRAAADAVAAMQGPTPGASRDRSLAAIPPATVVATQAAALPVGAAA